jgi:hypothetical protein
MTVTSDAVIVGMPWNVATIWDDPPPLPSAS